MQVGANLLLAQALTTCESQEFQETKFGESPFRKREKTKERHPALRFKASLPPKLPYVHKKQPLYSPRLTPRLTSPCIPLTSQDPDSPLSPLMSHNRAAP